jgi:hypothetical protein
LLPVKLAQTRATKRKFVMRVQIQVGSLRSTTLQLALFECAIFELRSFRALELFSAFSSDVVGFLLVIAGVTCFDLEFSNFSRYLMSRFACSYEFLRVTEFKVPKFVGSYDFLCIIQGWDLQGQKSKHFP